MSGIFVLSAVFFFLVEGFCSEEDKQPYPPLSLQRESPKGKVKTDVFIHSHVEAFGLLLLTHVHWVFVLIYIYLYIFNQISRNCTLREEYRDIWLQKRGKKKTSIKSIRTPSWAAPSCGTCLLLWFWFCCLKVSSLWATLLMCWRFCAAAPLRMHLSFSEKRLWRWILMTMMRRGVFYLLVNHACLPCTTLQPSICLHTEM